MSQRDEENDAEHMQAHELCEVLETTVTAWLALYREPVSVLSVLHAAEMVAAVWRQVALDQGVDPSQVSNMRDAAQVCMSSHLDDRRAGTESSGVSVTLTPTEDSTVPALEN